MPCMKCLAAEEKKKYHSGDWVYMLDYDTEFYNTRMGTDYKTLAIILEYKGKDEIVTVPSEINGYPVEKVSSFGSADTVREIHFSDGVMIIANNAFKNNQIISKIYFHNKYVIIGNSAFEGCSNLEEFWPECDELFTYHRSFYNTGIKLFYYTGILYCDSDTDSFEIGTRRARNHIEYYYFSVYLNTSSPLRNLLIIGEIFIIFAILYLLKLLFDRVKSKMGFKSLFDYKMYCKNSRDSFQCENSENDLVYNVPPKKRPFWYYFILLFAIGYIITTIGDICLPEQNTQAYFLETNSFWTIVIVGAIACLLCLIIMPLLILETYLIMRILKNKNIILKSGRIRVRKK